MKILNRKKMKKSMRVFLTTKNERVSLVKRLFQKNPMKKKRNIIKNFSNRC